MLPVVFVDDDKYWHDTHYNNQFSPHPPSPHPLHASSETTEHISTLLCHYQHGAACTAQHLKLEWVVPCQLHTSVFRCW